MNGRVQVTEHFVHCAEVIVGDVHENAACRVGIADSRWMRRKREQRACTGACHDIAI